MGEIAFMMHENARIAHGRGEGKSANPVAAASGKAILSAQAELRTKLRFKGKSKKRGPHIVAASLDVRSLVRDVQDILQRADEDQADLTERYIDAGRRLLEIRHATKHGEFEDLLAREFPHRSRSTLREYMTLAKAIDAADPAIQVQLAGLFPHGWGAVLGEIRRRMRVERGQHRNGQPANGDAKGNDLSILRGDCMARLRELPDESVDCIITSVPYFRCLVFLGATTVFGGDRHCVHDWEKRQFIRRHFNNASNIVESGTCRKCGARLVMLGWENTDAEYVQDVVDVFKQVKRVLKPTGVVWLNIADTYLDKELLLVPHRLGIALKDDGWICRQELIWHVTNRAPESTKDRFYRNHEHFFMFAKQKDHSFNAEGIREQAASVVKPGKRVRFKRQVDFRGIAGTWRSPGIVADGMRNRRTVWSIPNEPFRGGHPAAFPKALVEPMVLSSCPEGGVCLDPFAGTGTVGLVALAHGRKAILIEASAEYCGIAAKHRIETEIRPYKAELEKRRQQKRSNVPHAPRVRKIVQPEA
jgi:DNA modification methylase